MNLKKIIGLSVLGIGAGVVLMNTIGKDKKELKNNEYQIPSKSDNSAERNLPYHMTDESENPAVYLN